MSPTELRERLEDLQQDIATGDDHAHEVKRALGQALFEARLAEDKALCKHDYGKPACCGYGRQTFHISRCGKCGHTKTEEVA